MTIQFVAKKFELTPELEKYARTKASQLMRKLPRRLRRGAACMVTFSRVRKEDAELNACTISLRLDDVQLQAEEMTLHMYSSLDIAAVHIANQLKDYVAKQGGRGVRGVLHTYVHRPAR